MVSLASRGWGAAHPRSRGENRLRVSNRTAGDGSSPLTRGKRGFACFRSLFCRLIPAHAGKTSPARRASSVTRAHPRSRGENAKDAWLGNIDTGSSPLTRGKPPQERCRDSGGGLIPAHAGKTGDVEEWPRVPSAHPRSRGENALSYWPPRRRTGSSPLTRGKRAHSLRLALQPGLIPAHAGKTVTVSADDWSKLAHPRSRGENSHAHSNSKVAPGSSPLTRGKPAVPSEVRDRAGLIPAHAGKTSAEGARAGMGWAHPRSRGENSSRSTSRVTCSGSSPLTRGKLEVRLLGRRGLGLIPAHAGKTLCAPSLCLADGAHPRSRGENLPAWTSEKSAWGSSPLTRGKPALEDVAESRERLIPAHAGKTTR